jgi:hypothetical protein
MGEGKRKRTRVAGTTDADILAANLRAAAAIYTAAMLEQARVFQVTGLIVEMFGRGVLPIGSGPAGRALYEYWKCRAERLSEAERRAFYGRVLGMPGGETGANAVNTAFEALWLRFLASVSDFARQVEAGKILKPDQEKVRETARVIAVNLTQHTSGLALHAAADLQSEVAEAVKLLSYPEVKSAFGARDMWQVVDKVATQELGGAANSARYRALAKNGTAIIGWLAGHTQPLLRVRPVRLLDDATIRKRRLSKRPALTPGDYDLVTAVEAWLAASGDTGNDSQFA